MNADYQDFIIKLRVVYYEKAEKIFMEIFFCEYLRKSVS